MTTFAEEIKEELPEIPLEKIFENLLIELPVLPRGAYYVSEIAALVSFHKII